MDQIKNHYLQMRAEEIVADWQKRNGLSEAFKSEIAMVLLSMKPQDRILLIDQINLADRLEMNEQIREREDRIARLDLADGISNNMKALNEEAQG